MSVRRGGRLLLMNTKLFSCKMHVQPFRISFWQQLGFSSVLRLPPWCPAWDVHSSEAPCCPPSQPDRSPPQDSTDIWQPPTTSALPVTPADLDSCICAVLWSRFFSLIYCWACFLKRWLRFFPIWGHVFTAGVLRSSLACTLCYLCINTYGRPPLSTAAAVVSSICVCVGVKQTCLQGPFKVHCSCALPKMKHLWPSTLVIPCSLVNLGGHISLGITIIHLSTH